MADFCKSCTRDHFGDHAASTLDFGCKDDEVTRIICEGCGRYVWVKKDGTRVECNTCEHPDGCFQNSGVCENWKEAV